MLSVRIKADDGGWECVGIQHLSLTKKGARCKVWSHSSSKSTKIFTVLRTAERNAMEDIWHQLYQIPVLEGTIKLDVGNIKNHLPSMFLIRPLKLSYRLH